MTSIEIDDSQVLGSGTNGNVYRGEFNGVPVAVKWIRTDATCPSREESLMRLKHENVVTVLHAEVHDRNFWYTY